MKKHLIIDIGNTMIDARLYSEYGVDYFEFSKNEDCAKKISEHVSSEYVETLNVYISSVNRPTEKVIIDALKEKGVKNIFLLNTEVMKEYVTKHNIDVENISIIGGDLFADVIGGDIASGKTELIADFGTASKILLVENKKFVGGSISPGVYNCSKMLSEKTDLLEYVELKIPKNKFSLDTDEAINSGAIYGSALMLKGWYDLLKKEKDDIELIITGGAGCIISKVFNEMKVPHTYNKFRVLDGIIKAFGLDELLGGKYYA